MPVTVVHGEQRGDEGKGRFVDMLMPDHDIGARFNGGANAGHTVVAPDGEVYKLHGLPTAIVHEHAKAVIGRGAIINAVQLCQEIDTLTAQGIDIGPHNLLIDGGAHLTIPHHVYLDEHRENGDGRQGSTKSGIAQTYADKALRVGVRAELFRNNPEQLYDIIRERLHREKGWLSRISPKARKESRDQALQYVSAAKRLGEMVTDATIFLNAELDKDDPANVLAEGAQAFLLDLDHGMYPYTTSSSTTVGGVITGLGIPPHHIGRTIGVTKAIQSHVGGGPFVTEIHDEQLLDRLHGNRSSIDAERGTTTGRTRRLGHLDLPQTRRSQMINGTTELALTKLDWVPRYGEQILVCVGYKRKGKDLKIAPDSARKLLESEPIYEVLPNWTEDISDVREFEELPDEAQNYVHFMEQQTGKKVTLIGVGPQRDQVIVR